VKIGDKTIPQGLMMSRYSSLWELYATRLREFYRQPARVFWVYVFPTILAVGLGIAFKSQKPQPVHATVVVASAGAGIGAPLEVLERPEVRTGRAGRSGLVVDTDTEAGAMHRLRTGKTALVVGRGADGRVEYHYDETRPEAVTARTVVDEWLQAGNGRVDPVATGDVLVTEHGSRYIDFLIPGLIGLNIMGGGLWGVGFLLVNFRLGKLLKRFQATPMPRQNFLLSILGARLTFLLPDVLTLLAVGHFLFQVPMRGNPVVFGLVVILGALAFAGIGLLVGSRAATIETAQGLMNLVMLPMWLLSGVFFASDRFPAVMQPLIQALPLTQTVGGLRRVMLEGAGIGQVWPGLLILAAWAVVSFVLALRIFKWS
jgi:hypothetical protein